MSPGLLHGVALTWLTLGLLSASIILADIVLGKRDIMAVMKWAWPINALYMGPIAIWAYWTMGRMGMAPMKGTDQPPFWHTVFKGVTHCGAGCTLGDIIAEWVIFLAAWQFAGQPIWVEFIGDFLLAYLLGVAFQYFAIAPMRGLGLRDGVVAAIKADTLSLSAFELGLFAWMALMAFVYFHPALHPDSVVYWFMMQVGMIVGFLTSFPMNWWLIRRGIKEAM